MNRFKLLCSTGVLLAVTGSAALFAETPDEKMLDALSSEADNTTMNAPGTITPADAEPAVLPDENTDIDALTDSVASQLSAVLNGADAADNKETGDELEKVISGEMIKGNSLDDIRDAVSAAMSEYKQNTPDDEATQEKVKAAEQSLQKLVGKAPYPEQNIENNYLESLKQEAEENSSSSKKKPAAKATTPKAVVKKTEPANKQPRKNIVRTAQASDGMFTVQVLQGESLYKIALRVYGEGDRYMDLYRANRDIIKDPNVIRTGQILKIPR